MICLLAIVQCTFGSRQNSTCIRCGLGTGWPNLFVSCPLATTLLGPIIRSVTMPIIQIRPQRMQRSRWDCSDCQVRADSRCNHAPLDKKNKNQKSSSQILLLTVCTNASNSRRPAKDRAFSRPSIPPQIRKLAS